MRHTDGVRERAQRTWLRPALSCAAALLASCALAPAEPEHEPGFGLTTERLAAAVGAVGLDSGADVLIAVGDIARCDALAPAEATAALAAAFVAAAGQARVITMGDHAYERGTAEEFERCYAPTWGRFDALTLPSPGNHDYDTDAGAPYFDHFTHFDRDPDARARGYYSFEFAGWHVVSLNSLLPMTEGSAQLEWLARDLREARSECLLAYWHHPRLSSGIRSVNPFFQGKRTRDAWEILARFDAELIVNGHEHFYERFAPLNGTGDAAVDGLRQFIVGTGGGDLQSAVLNRANSEAVYDDGYGVLLLMLSADSYSWAFVGIDGVVHDRSADPTPCA